LCLFGISPFVGGSLLLADIVLLIAAMAASQAGAGA
jgi:hypothetical protein